MPGQPAGARSRGPLHALVLVLGLAFSAAPFGADRSSTNAYPRQILERGPHHRLVCNPQVVKDKSGALVTQSNLVMEIATGLHYWDGEWKESRPLLESFAHGVVGRHSQHQLIVSHRLDAAGAIDCLAPDGKRFRSHILGLGYADQVSGRSVLFARVRNGATGAILPPHQIVFTNAFEGIVADVLYTYRMDGLEQDVVIAPGQDFPPPEAFDLPGASSRLEVWTEFLEPPTPGKVVAVVHGESDPGRRQAMAEPDVIDEQLDFGAMRIGVSKAFWRSQQSDRPGPPEASEAMAGDLTPTKRWLRIETRDFLVESLDYQAVKPYLDRLGQRGKRTARVETSGRRVYAARAGNLPEVRELEAAERQPMLAASAPYQPEGFVWDYVQLQSQSDVTLYSGWTYHVQGNVNLSGTTTIQGGACVKYSHSGAYGITISGPVNCQTSSSSWAYFLAESDNSRGEQVVAGAPVGVPPFGRYAGTALRLETYSSQTTLSYLDVRNAGVGIAWYNRSGTVANCRFADCDVGVNASSQGVNLQNLTFCNVSTPWQGGTFTESGSAYSCHSSIGDDHGDTISSATPVALNSTTAGSINIAGDQDFYRISIPSPTTLTVYTTGTTDTYGFLLDAYGNEVAWNDDNPYPNFRIECSVPDGIYYVRVRHYGTGTGSYTLHVETTGQGVGGGSATPLVTSQSLGADKSDFTGWVGFKFTVGSSPLTVRALGRWVDSGNSQTHRVKLVDSGGYDVAGGEVTVDTYGAPAGTYLYAPIEPPVTLSAGQSYYLLAHETAGGDHWHDLDTQVTLSGTSGHAVPAYALDAWTHSYYAADAPFYYDKTYGPVNLLYSNATADDHGNDLLGASAMRLGGRIAGLINFVNDSDYFRVEVPDTTVTTPVYLTLYTVGGGDTLGDLYDANGVLLCSAGSTGDFFINRFFTPGGAYYVRVRRAFSQTGAYVLKVEEGDHRWFASTGPPGDGTSRLTPYVFTHDQFRAWVNSGSTFGEGLTVHFLPGSAGSAIYSGAKQVVLTNSNPKFLRIEGEGGMDPAGRAKVTLKLDPTASEPGNPLAGGHWFLCPDCDGAGLPKPEALANRIEVRDLTFDCNWAGQTGIKTTPVYPLGYKSGALYLYAKTMGIRNVAAKNFGANGVVPVPSSQTQGTEAFPFCIFTPDLSQAPVDGDPAPVVIEDCEVSDFTALHGGYCTGIIISVRNPDPYNSATMAVVQRCQVRGLRRVGIAFGAVWAERVIFRDNAVVDCTYGFNSDTYSLKMIQLYNNTFLDVSSGILAGGPLAPVGGFLNYDIHHNAIRLSGQAIHRIYHNYSVAAPYELASAYVDQSLDLGRQFFNDVGAFWLAGGTDQMNIHDNNVTSRKSGKFAWYAGGSPTYRVVRKLPDPASFAGVGPWHRVADSYSDPALDNRLGNRRSGLWWDFGSFSAEVPANPDLEDNWALPTGDPSPGFTADGRLGRVEVLGSGSVHELAMGEPVINGNMVTLKARWFTQPDSAPRYHQWVYLRVLSGATQVMSMVGCTAEDGVIDFGTYPLISGNCGRHTVLVWVNRPGDPNPDFEPDLDYWATTDYTWGTTLSLDSTPDVARENQAWRKGYVLFKRSTTSGALAVTFRVEDAWGQSATWNTDYYFYSADAFNYPNYPGGASGTITIADGASQAVLKVQAMPDSFSDENEGVRLKITEDDNAGVVILDQRETTVMIHDGY